MVFFKQAHCDIEGCPKPHLAKGLCRMHYYRRERTGTTDEAPPRERATCSVDGCPSVVKGNGLCNRHYQQVRDTGAVRDDDTRTYVERFWDRVDQSAGPEACWPWRQPLLPTGYGQAKHEGRNRGVHVIAWVLTNGPVPDGLEVDHRCHTTDCRLGNGCPHRACCNPLHLLAVPPEENRSPERCTFREAAGAHQRAKTRCPDGHYYNKTNTYVTPRGDRHCRFCARNKAWRLRNGDMPRPLTDLDRLAMLPPEDEAAALRKASPSAAKLTAKQVADIRERYATGGVRQVDLAAEFGVSRNQIGRIVRGKSWSAAS